MWAMLAAIWFTAVVRKVVTKSVPSLVTISLTVLTVQTLPAIVTGSLWIFLFRAFGIAVEVMPADKGASPLPHRDLPDRPPFNSSTNAIDLPVDAPAVAPVRSRSEPSGGI